MIRARIWFRCAAAFDPVSPIQVSPASIGWEAKKREVDLVIGRGFKGEELLERMKGWITVDPVQVIETIRPHGRLKILDDRILVVEFEGRSEFDALGAILLESFSDQVELEPMTPL